MSEDWDGTYALRLRAQELRIKELEADNCVCAAVDDPVGYLRRQLAAAEAAIARVRSLHKPFRLYDECGHDHEYNEPGTRYIEELSNVTCEDGFLYEICDECCAHRGEQSKECLDDHDHGPGKPICATIAALDGTEEKKA